MIDKLIDLGLKDLFSTYPAKTLKLSEVLAGNYSIPLTNGITHYFDKKEVERLSEILPIYMWGLVDIPIVLAKTTTPGEYVIKGGEYAVRAIGRILNKEDLGQSLTSIEVDSLIKRFRSIVFISLSLDNITKILQQLDNEDFSI